MKNVKHYIDTNREKFVSELIEWLKIPSISTLSEYRQDVFNAGKWAEQKLVSLGFPEVECIEGEGHPLIFAEWSVDREMPTLLLYGHYDVQPVDPIDEWNSDPFDPEVDETTIYARGATDDKGQLMIVFAALEAWVKSHGLPPVNIKVLLEGEEEAGGRCVDLFVKEHAERLKCDAALICDTHMNSPENPSLIIGLRGILYTEVAVSGARRDLHSGSYGGVAPNPLHALCLLLSRLKGEDGQIAIPELFNSGTVSETEKNFWKENDDFLTARLLDEMGVDSLVGENDISPHERLGVRPTLEVHGIRGGFTGEGAKTVIPADAVAKVSMRLPAGVDPAEAFTHFKNTVMSVMPDGYNFSVTNLHAGNGVSVSSDNIFVRKAAAAIEKTYGILPVYMREGGSIPIAALFDDVLNVPVVLMGFGLPDDGAHGPNEKFSLDQFYKGIVTLSEYLGSLRG